MEIKIANCGKFVGVVNEILSLDAEKSDEKQRETAVSVFFDDTEKEKEETIGKLKLK